MCPLHPQGAFGCRNCSAYFNGCETTPQITAEQMANIKKSLENLKELCSHGISRQYRCDYCEEEKYCSTPKVVPVSLSKYQKAKEWSKLWKSLAKELFEELTWDINNDITDICVENERLKQQLDFSKAMHDNIVIQRDVAWKENEFLEEKVRNLETLLYGEFEE